MEGAQRLEQRGLLGLLAAQRRQHCAFAAEMLQLLLDRRQQDRMGAHLHKGGVTLRHQSSKHRREHHRFPEVADPVGGVHRHALCDLPRHRRIERDAARARTQAGEGVEQVAAQCVHLGAMGSHVDLDAPTEDVAGLEGGDQLIEGGGVARQHGRARAIAHRHREPVLVSGDRRLRLREGELDQRHRSLPSRPPQEPAATADHAGGVLQAEDTRHVGGGDLSHAVTDHGGGLDSPRPPPRGQGDLDGEQRGLDDVDLVQARASRIGGQLVQNGEARLLAHRPVARLERRPKDGVPRQQPAPHAQPLRALAGEYERDPRRARRCGAGDGGPRPRLVVQESIQVVGGLRRAAGYDGQAVIVVRPANGSRVADVGKGRRIGTKMVAPGRGHLPERLRAASGQGQQPRALVGALGRAFRRWRRLLEHDVGVGAGDTERADTGQGGTGLCGPGHHGDVHER